MTLLEVLTPPSFYRGCSTQKLFCEEKFTPVNMKKGVRCNVRKHREIEDSDKYITLEIYLYFGSM